MKTVSQIQPQLKQKRRRHAPEGTNIKQLRIKSLLTMREVSEFTGIPLVTLHRIEESGECKVSAAIILAHFYETTVEELFK